MSDVVATNSSDHAASRRRQRQERQARVGLLRNPNHAPKPPTRRTALMGKWLDLRSSRRRPPAKSGDAPLAEVPTVAPITRIDEAIVHDQSGGVAGINIDGLMQVVRDLGTDKPLRTPYASGSRGDLDPEVSHIIEEKQHSILSAKAWVDEPESPAQPDVEPAAPGSRRARRNPKMLRAMTIICGGILMGLVVLLVLPAVAITPD